MPTILAPHLLDHSEALGCSVDGIVLTAIGPVFANTAIIDEVHILELSVDARRRCVLTIDGQFPLMAYSVVRVNNRAMDFQVGLELIERFFIRIIKGVMGLRCVVVDART